MPQWGSTAVTAAAKTRAVADTLSAERRSIAIRHSTHLRENDPAVCHTLGKRPGQGAVVEQEIRRPGAFGNSGPSRRYVVAAPEERVRRTASSSALTVPAVSCGR